MNYAGYFYCHFLTKKRRVVDADTVGSRHWWVVVGAAGEKWVWLVLPLFWGKP